MDHDSIIEDSVSSESDTPGPSNRRGRRRKKDVSGWERTKMKKSRIAVTSANGFVGQHFMKHMQMFPPSTLREIRVLDEKNFTKKLDYESPIPVKSYVGTTFDPAALDEALSGVDTIVHLQELKDTSMLPDKEEMKRINVKGVQAILAACKEHSSVKRFLLLSSSDIMLANYLACDANVREIWPIPETNWVYPEYCSSKYEAEKITFECADIFQCFAVRLGPMYGELDDQEWGIAAHLKLGKRCGGVVPHIGDGDGTIAHTYAGNVGYEMVKVLEKMVADPKATRETVFSSDNTPEMAFYALMDPIIKAKNYRMSPLPFWFVFVFIPYWILQKVARLTEFVNCCGLKKYLKQLPCARILVDYFYTYITFSPFKANTYIQYIPLYNFEESMKNSIKYYTSDEFE